MCINVSFSYSMPSRGYFLSYGRSYGITLTRISTARICTHNKMLSKCLANLMTSEKWVNVVKSCMSKYHTKANTYPMLQTYHC